MRILRRGLFLFFLLLNKDGEKKKLVAFSPFLRCCVSTVGGSRANVLSSSLLRSLLLMGFSGLGSSRGRDQHIEIDR